MLPSNQDPAFDGVSDDPGAGRQMNSWNND
jgi:hypothetical protein